MKRSPFANRLRKARHHFGLTQQVVAEKVGAGYWTRVSEWERGVSQPSMPFVSKLPTVLRNPHEQVNLNWLLTGRGDMTCPRSTGGSSRTSR